MTCILAFGHKRPVHISPPQSYLSSQVTSKVNESQAQIDCELTSSALPAIGPLKDTQCSYL